MLVAAFISIRCDCEVKNGSQQDCQIAYRVMYIATVSPVTRRLFI
ncbi:hypothetical protein DIKCMJMK_03339 [Shewanella oneidensis]|nr:hypothetical protein [Shewanella oneidensis]